MACNTTSLSKNIQSLTATIGIIPTVVIKYIYLITKGYKNEIILYPL